MRPPGLSLPKLARRPLGRSSQPITSFTGLNGDSLFRPASGRGELRNMMRLRIRSNVSGLSTLRTTSKTFIQNILGTPSRRTLNGHSLRGVAIYFHAQTKEKSTTALKGALSIMIDPFTMENSKGNIYATKDEEMPREILLEVECPQCKGKQREDVFCLLCGNSGFVLHEKLRDWFEQKMKDSKILRPEVVHYSESVELYDLEGIQIEIRRPL